MEDLAQVHTALTVDNFMIESENFSDSLNHSNPARPHFAIGTGMDAQMTITHQGQVMQLPIAEVLSFVQRWNADQDHQWETGMKRAGLRLFPYPLHSVRMTDPDAVGVSWGPV
jgi:hypothetical protein